MSVTVPTVRKTREGEETSAPKDRLGQRAKRRKPRAAWTLVFCCLAAVILIYAIYSLAKADSGKTIAVFKNSVIALAAEKCFVVKTENETLTVDPSGTTEKQNSDYDHWLTSGSLVVGYNRSGMMITDPSSSAPGTGIALRQGEKPVSVEGGNVVLTYKPYLELEFGDAWAVYAYREDGSEIWTNEITYAPFMAACGTDSILIGATNISAGSTQWLVCISKHSGKFLWQKKLGPGFWRELAFLSSSQAVAVLDTGAFFFDLDGNLTGEHRPDGTIVSAAVSDASGTAIAVVPSFYQATGGVLGKSQVFYLSNDAAVNWARTCHDLYPKLLALDTLIVALGQNTVTAYELKEGRILSSFRVKGHPKACAKGVILVESNGEVSLVSHEILEACR